MVCGKVLRDGKRDNLGIRTMGAALSPRLV